MRPDRQQRIVDAHRARTDHDGVVLGTQIVHPLARGFARDAMDARMRGNEAVERHRHLQRDERIRRADRVAESFD